MKNTALDIEFGSKCNCRSFLFSRTIEYVTTTQYVDRTICDEEPYVTKMWRDGQEVRSRRDVWGLTVASGLSGETQHELVGCFPLLFSNCIVYHLGFPILYILGLIIIMLRYWCYVLDSIVCLVLYFYWLLIVCSFLFINSVDEWESCLFRYSSSWISRPRTK